MVKNKINRKIASPQYETPMVMPMLHVYSQVRGSEFSLINIDCMGGSTVMVLQTLFGHMFFSNQMPRSKQGFGNVFQHVSTKRGAQG